MASPILLLKSPSPNSAQDPYTHALSQDFAPHFVPVLTHTLLPDPLIKLLLTYLDPASARSSQPFPYGAIILTSQRAAAALNAAFASPILQQKVGQDRLQGLSNLRLYVVGPATKRAAEQVVNNHVPGCTIWGGEEAGSGEELAKLMLGTKGEGRWKYDVWDDEDGDDHAMGVRAGQTNKDGADGSGNTSEDRGLRKPVLFLAGETRRDIIPKMLQSSELVLSERVKVEEVTVYKTEELQEFEFEFESVLARTQPVDGASRWIVVFSPTAGQGMLKGLKWLNKGSGKVDRSMMSGRKDFVCCIGPTTRSYLDREFGFQADVIAESPSPQGLLRGIRNHVAHSEAAT